MCEVTVMGVLAFGRKGNSNISCLGNNTYTFKNVIKIKTTIAPVCLLRNNEICPKRQMVLFTLGLGNIVGIAAIMLRDSNDVNKFINLQVKLPVDMKIDIECSQSNLYEDRHAMKAGDGIRIADMWNEYEKFYRDKIDNMKVRTILQYPLFL